MIEYFINLAILINIYIIVSVSLQITIGYTGLFNIGHIGFFAIGAYTTALLALSGHIFFICFLASGIVSMLVGLLLSITMKRISKDTFSLVCMGFCFIVFGFFLNWTNITNGGLGLSGIPKPNIFLLNLTDNTQYFTLTLMISIVSVFLIHRIVKSPVGRVLEAIRDDELATRSLGKDVFKMKAISVLVSAFFAGISGSLYAYYFSYINPYMFTMNRSITFFLIVFIGGLTSIKGTLIATFLILLIPEALRFTVLPETILGPIRQILFALALLLLLIYRPKGLYGKVEV